MAPTDIFHSRKYAQMNSTTRTRKTPRPRRARLATWAPHVAPIASRLTASASTPTASWIASETVVASSLSSGSVWTRMFFGPDVFTIGDRAPSMFSSSAVWATASRIFWTLSCEAWSAGIETWYSTPPLNSMPRLSPLPTSP